MGKLCNVFAGMDDVHGEQDTEDEEVTMVTTGSTGK